MCKFCDAARLPARAPADAGGAGAKASSSALPQGIGAAWRKTLIKGGHVLSVDPGVGNFARGDVLIEGSKILAVAPQIDAGDAAVIDAAGHVVMPGFIDTHHHQFETALRSILADAILVNDGRPESAANYYEWMLQKFSVLYRPEDVYISELFGSISQIDAGVTTVMDVSQIHHSPEHSDAAIKALQDAGSVEKIVPADEKPLARRELIESRRLGTVQEELRKAIADLRAQDEFVQSSDALVDFHDAIDSALNDAKEQLSGGTPRGAMPHEDEAVELLSAIVGALDEANAPKDDEDPFGEEDSGAGQQGGGSGSRERAEACRPTPRSSCSARCRTRSRARRARSASAPSRWTRWRARRRSRSSRPVSSASSSLARRSRRSSGRTRAVRPWRRRNRPAAKVRKRRTLRPLRRAPVTALRATRQIPVFPGESRHDAPILS